MTALVERPNVLLCRFDDAFLAVPPECLVLTMKANQKYFPLLDAQGRLTEKFLVVANIRPSAAMSNSTNRSAPLTTTRPCGFSSPVHWIVVVIAKQTC